jgi:hypothetical protein
MKFGGYRVTTDKIVVTQFLLGYTITFLAPSLAYN